MQTCLWDPTHHCGCRFALTDYQPVQYLRSGYAGRSRVYLAPVLGLLSVYFKHLCGGEGKLIVKPFISGSVLRAIRRYSRHPEHVRGNLLILSPHPSSLQTPEGLQEGSTLPLFVQPWLDENYALMSSPHVCMRYRLLLANSYDAKAGLAEHLWRTIRWFHCLLITPPLTSRHKPPVTLLYIFFFIRKIYISL